MRLLLREDVPKLGRRGDIVRVKDGYGRNFLLPRRKAVQVSAANLQQIEDERKRIAIADAKRKVQLTRVAEEFETRSWNIEVKMNEEGHLFGSVTYQDLAKVFAASGFEVDESTIALEDEERYPIKEKGIYAVKIHLHPEVTATTKVWVVEETV